MHHRYPPVAQATKKTKMCLETTTLVQRAGTRNIKLNKVVLALKSSVHEGRQTWMDTWTDRQTDTHTHTLRGRMTGSPPGPVRPRDCPEKD